VRAEQLRAEVSTALADRQLLRHPFYCRWEAGELALGDIAAYASQYSHFEASLPTMLRRLVAQLGDHPAAESVRRNLDDEESNPMPHVELFAMFAAAVGTTAEPAAGAAARHLVDTYNALIDAGPAEGLAAMVAYEMQAPAIAASKADGLRKHYRIDAAGTAFWDVHATMDTDHADWTFEALAGLPVVAGTIVTSARAGADAWWEFLDERELTLTR
jgi:pyrroloquinoline quinone (PQQ) biosynthesis protein C